MYLIALILMLHALPESLPSSRSGTIVALDFSNERLIIATDSRVTDDDGHINDCECKIHIIGTGMVFAASGIQRQVDNSTHKTTFDAVHIAAEVRRSNSTASVEKVATLWASKVKSAIGELGERNRKAILGRLINDQFVVSGIFIGAESDGHIAAYNSEIRYDLIGETIVLTNVVGPIKHGVSTFFHDGEFAQELFASKTKRAHDEAIRLSNRLNAKHIADPSPYFLVAGVEAAIKWKTDELIGGDVDALIVHKNGKIKWFKKKKNCDRAIRQQPNR